MKNSNRHHLGIHWSFSIRLNQSPKEVFAESTMSSLLAASIETSFGCLFVVF
jgi:hypothetical protein